MLVRQRPGSAGGVTFMTLEDETGQLNLIVWKNIGERFRRPLVEAALLEVQGTLQREGQVLHLVARRLIDRTALTGRLQPALTGFSLTRRTACAEELRARGDKQIPQPQLLVIHERKPE